MQSGKTIPALLLACSIITLLAMLVGGFATYSPSFSANDIQNIYLSRMLWFSGVSITLQIASLTMQFFNAVK